MRIEDYSNQSTCTLCGAIVPQNQHICMECRKKQNLKSYKKKSVKDNKKINLKHRS